MKELREYRENLLKRFESVVDDLRRAAAAVPPERLHTPAGPKGFSPHQTMTHLWGIEAHALSLRLRLMIDADRPDFELFNDRAWLKANHRPEQPVEELIEEYARLRRAEMTWIRDLPPDGWNRTSRHPWFGVRTFQWWVEHCLAYAEEHLRALRQAAGG